jgi:malonyl-CoA/methylmalonyl-CoA synthetase
MTESDEQNLYTAYQSCFPADRSRELLRSQDGTCFSYADAERASARLANCLVAMGARPGDRVTVQVEKSPQALWLYLACLRAGLVFHPLNTAYREQELKFFLENARPHIVICDSRSERSMNAIAGRCGVDRVLTLDADGWGSLMSASVDHPTEFATVPREADDLAALLYSSGTTGRPKGIMLSHANLASNGKTLVETWGFTAGDRLLHALPIYHVHGLFVAIGCVLFSGAAMHWMDRFDAGEALRALPDCSVVMGVPTYYTRLLAEPDFGREACANCRLFVSGSAPLLEETFAEFATRTGHTILERYGMTETGMNTSNPLQGERRSGSVGLPLAGVEVRVVDTHGKPLPAGEAGDLQVRGANVFKGYWEMPEKTREDFTDDGFFNTGDVACIAEDGYVSIVGRSKDMIISGGLNIYPREIEMLLDTLEGVGESAVVGVPHADFGEAVVAVVVPTGDGALTEDAVVAFSKDKLASFKAPRRVFFVDDLPRNAMGKVQKNVLRERYGDCCKS